MNQQGETPAEVVRARRKRRLEAAGLPFEEPPRESFVGIHSRAEVVRLNRQRGRDAEAACSLDAERGASACSGPTLSLVAHLIGLHDGHKPALS